MSSPFRIQSETLFEFAQNTQTKLKYNFQIPHLYPVILEKQLAPGSHVSLAAKEAVAKTPLLLNNHQSVSISGGLRGYQIIVTKPKVVPGGMKLHCFSFNKAMVKYNSLLKKKRVLVQRNVFSYQFKMNI